MQIVAMLNQKGGVGKTSTCFHLAGLYGSRGLRVLLVDNDPQASLTQGFFGPDGLAAVKPSESVTAAYEGDVWPASLVVPTGVSGVDLIRGSSSLVEHNNARGRGWPDSQWGLRRLLDEIAADYDLCLIDCPPNLCLCARAALLAADTVVIPIQAEDFGAQGLAPVVAAMVDARDVNQPLYLAGYLLTMFDARLSLHKMYEGILREHYGTDVFAAVVPRAKDFGEAVAVRSPVSICRPRGVAARALAAVADELAERVSLTAPGAKGAA